MVVEECSLLDLYTGIQSKQSGPIQACNLSATLGKVAAFGTCIRFVVEQPETEGYLLLMKA